MMSRVERSPWMALGPGQLLAYRYRLGAPLGRGGAAQTYRAEDLVSGDVVALKLLHASLPVGALRLEFERVRELGHPHLTRVHEFALTQLEGRRRAFYTAALVEGQDLASFVRASGFARARRAFADVLDALHLLHRLGLRHGDVKPDNVLVDADGRATLIDLGCTAPLGKSSALLSGTPGFMAPELLRGEAADERADLFAFGVMLRDACDVPALGPLLARLTAEHPRDRPASAREVLSLLGDPRDVDSSTRGRATRLVGRAATVRNAEKALLAAAHGEPGPRCVWLHGAAGVGRTRMLRELGFVLASAEVVLLDARSADRAPLREALQRKTGVIEPGLDALAEQLRDSALERQGCVLVLDDAEALAPEAALELRFAIDALPPSGRVALLVASSTPAPRLGAAVLQLELAPLVDAELAEWAEGVLEPARIGDLARFTGGYPRYVERTLAALGAGRMREADLRGASLALEGDDDRALSLALSGLDREARVALCDVALGVPPAALPSVLLARDLVRVHGARVELVRAADRAPVLAALEPALLRERHARAADRLAGSAHPNDRARAFEYAVRAGRDVQLEDEALQAPRVFAPHLAAVAERLGAKQRFLLARLWRLAGEAKLALAQLARARREHGTAEFFVEAAEVYLALGQATRAERYLARVADASELGARVAVRLGAYAQARERAERALAHETSPSARARALESLALAETYLGDPSGALARLDEAFALHGHDELRARARCVSLRGFVLLRAGRTAEAASAYAEAHQLAEPHGLSDLVLNALSNLGNARQSLGQWGTALDTFERALRLARALERPASVRSLRANLANLCLEIGAFERARAELGALASGSGSAALQSALELYRAELALLTGEPASARAIASALRARVDTPQRERVEAQLLHVEAELLLGADVTFALDERELPDDLRARAAEVEARVLAAQGHTRAGVQRLERTLEHARTLLDPALLARLEGTLAQLCEQEGASALASEQRLRARARWERIALDLPPALRDAFWAHPRRVQPRSQGEPASRSTLSLARVRELNRRIGALHERDEVLTFALSAAIELTAAERGFVLLRESGGERDFAVAVAQNMEGARVRKSEWKWSRSIAERVIRDGEPVLTVDAGSDPRFQRQASVHAMQLKSVLCAPIRSGHEVVGALYLDNRLARARFQPEDAELLWAFADQVAIALAHAELVRQLSQKARELAREKGKVEQLARGQAVEIERLAGELSAHKASYGTRYEYRDIVGRSEAMRRVLGVLDRVMASDLSVLVQGESGTGKELIARALHEHGPRKNKPFVAINCAALPEALLESELFGHVKGAFTGATQAHEGLFVSARSGTLFLDELGELPLTMQSKLLRVLNDGEVRAVGANKSRKVDVRLICATNRDLEERVRSGAFREDLYYRVSVVALSLPPLRERRDDIVPIAERILERHAEASGTARCKLGADAVRALLTHPFPGNVRELQNTLQRASVMASGGVIRAADLELAPRAPPRTVANTRGEYAQKEAERLLYALEAERWNVSRVAKNLGIPRNTLYRKLARHGIHKARAEEPTGD